MKIEIAIVVLLIVSLTFNFLFIFIYNGQRKFISELHKRLKESETFMSRVLDRKVRVG